MDARNEITGEKSPRAAWSEVVASKTWFAVCPLGATLVEIKRGVPEAEVVQNRQFIPTYGQSVAEISRFFYFSTWRPSPICFLSYGPYNPEDQFAHHTKFCTSCLFVPTIVRTWTATTS